MTIYDDARKSKMYTVQQGFKHFDVITKYNQRTAIYYIKQDITQRNDNVNFF